MRGIIQKSNVKVIVTTDDPVDDLSHHKKIADDPSFNTAVYPGWRPDKLLGIERDDFTDYLQQLAKAAEETEVKTMTALQTALTKRMELFHNAGCRASDHGINNIVYAPASEEDIDRILKKRITGESITTGEADAFRWAILLFLGEEYHKRGWVMEIHFGAVRNNNTRCYKALGPDTGFDAINNENCMPGLGRLLDALEYLNI